MGKKKKDDKPTKEQIKLYEDAKRLGYPLPSGVTEGSWK